MYFGSGYSGTYYGFNPVLEYFVMDNLSLGASVELAESKWERSTSLGPSISFYFARMEKRVLSLHQSIRYAETEYIRTNSSSKSEHKRSTTSFVFNYFTTPEVALGIGLGHFRNIDDSEANDNTSIFSKISIHL